MTIIIDPKLEARLRERAKSARLTVSAYLERLVHSDDVAAQELETLALEGFNSGTPIAVGPDYWREKHRLLYGRLRCGSGFMK